MSAQDERAAIEACVEGGVVGFIQRIRGAHGPAFAHTDHQSDRYPNGVVYAGCKCGEVGCSYPLFLVHISDLTKAYESKVQDFAAETLRAAGGWVTLEDMVKARSAAPREEGKQ